MKKFYLKSGKDIISKVDAVSLDQAIKFFSIQKKLKKDDLLKLFIVTDQM